MLAVVQHQQPVRAGGPGGERGGARSRPGTATPTVSATVRATSPAPAVAPGPPTDGAYAPARCWARRVLPTPPAYQAHQARLRQDLPQRGEQPVTTDQRPRPVAARPDRRPRPGRWHGHCGGTGGAGATCPATSGLAWWPPPRLGPAQFFLQALQAASAANASGYASAPSARQQHHRRSARGRPARRRGHRFRRPIRSAVPPAAGGGVAALLQPQRLPARRSRRTGPGRTPPQRQRLLQASQCSAGASGSRPSAARTRSRNSRRAAERASSRYPAVNCTTAPAGPRVAQARHVALHGVARRGHGPIRPQRHLAGPPALCRRPQQRCQQARCRPAESATGRPLRRTPPVPGREREPVGHPRICTTQRGNRVRPRRMLTAPADRTARTSSRSEAARGAGRAARDQRPPWPAAALCRSPHRDSAMVAGRQCSTLAP